MSQVIRLDRRERNLVAVAAAFGVGLRKVAPLCLCSEKALLRALERDRRLGRRVAASRRRGARLSAESRAEANPRWGRSWRRNAERVIAQRAEEDGLLAI